MTEDLVPSVSQALVVELQGLIEETRERVARNVNSELVLLYWHLMAHRSWTRFRRLSQRSSGGVSANATCTT